MDNNYITKLVKKLIQKQLLNELCNNGLIDFFYASNIIKKLEEDISKLKEIEMKEKDLKNITVKITV